MKYPMQVCDDCGIQAHKNKAKRLNFRSTSDKHTLSTYHKGKCDVCKKIKMVTEPRDYFYPDLVDFEKVRKQIKEARSIKHIETLMPENTDEFKSHSLFGLFNLMVGIITGVAIGIFITKFKMFGL